MYSCFLDDRESLVNPCFNTGVFLKTLKLLPQYDQPINEHLEEVRIHGKEHCKADACKKGGKNKNGRGSWLAFLSNDIQDKFIKIIGQEISSMGIDR